MGLATPVGLHADLARVMRESREKSDAAVRKAAEDSESKESGSTAFRVLTRTIAEHESTIAAQQKRIHEIERELATTSAKLEQATVAGENASSSHQEALGRAKTAEEVSSAQRYRAQGLAVDLHNERVSHAQTKGTVAALQDRLVAESQRQIFATIDVDALVAKVSSTIPTPSLPQQLPPPPHWDIVIGARDGNGSIKSMRVTPGA